MEDKLYVFNYKQNRDKLFANLIGIIDGIVADGVVLDEEVLYLDTWLLEASQIIRNGVIKGLSRRVSDILANGVITDGEREEIKAQLHKIQRELLDIPDIDIYSAESDLHLLNGLCKGLISDRKLSSDEIKYLDWWLTQNGTLKNNYPGRNIYSLVKEIISDGIITPEESNRLYKVLVDFTGCDLDSGVVDGLSTRLPADEIDNLIFTGKTFCLTGVFIAGKRSLVEEQIINAGGVVCDGITKKLDYLIVGTLSSRDWKFSSHGRKIEKAISYRDEHSTGIKILTEDTLFGALP